MAWDEGQTLAARFEHACAAARSTHRHWTLGTSYSGFAEALERSTPPLAQALKRRFQREMLRIAGPYRRRGRWMALAVDGTRLEAPHTAANERDLGCAGKEKTAPQVFLTTLWHMGTGLPWDYRVGPGTASERAHLKQMTPDLPPGALVVADAGFVGYPLCLRLLRHGKHFLLRVGGNLTLLKDLGYSHREGDGLVYLWPQKHRRHRPLVLRLIALRHGKQDVSLLTDVLDPAQLTDEEAATLYGMRWGEEVFYRSYKQTMQRRKLLSRRAGTCLPEAQWTLLGLWLLGLMTASRLIEAGDDPLAMSAAGARDAVRQVLRARRPRRGPRSLTGMLRAAVKDGYVRHTSKAARNDPRKKRERPPKPPRIQSATKAEVKRARKLPPPEIPSRWTA
jgi:Transposase DDE domain